MKLGKKSSSKEHKIRGQQYLTLMFITDATKEHKAIKIPKWLRFPLLMITVLIILGALSLYDYVASLEALVVENNLLTQEALIESESKQSIISELEDELNVTKYIKTRQKIFFKERMQVIFFYRFMYNGRCIFALCLSKSNAKKKGPVCLCL